MYLAGEKVEQPRPFTYAVVPSRVTYSPLSECVRAYVLKFSALEIRVYPIGGLSKRRRRVRAARKEGSLQKEG